MVRLQYRNFGVRKHGGNFTVDVDGANHAGIRWFELRRNSGTWNLEQEGTYAPDADHVGWAALQWMVWQHRTGLQHFQRNDNSIHPLHCSRNGRCSWHHASRSYPDYRGGVQPAMTAGAITAPWS